MKYNTEIKKLPNSEIEIIGQISADYFDSCREKAIKDLSDGIKVDGFRPGNVPEKILIEKIGEPAILEQTAEIALGKMYPEIIKENNIQAIGRPEIVITKIARGNPLEFKAKTAVLPDIELPDYKKIASKVEKEKEDVVVEEKEVDQVIEHLRKSRASKNDKGEEVVPELNDEFAKTMGKFENVGDLKKIIEKNIQEEKKIKLQEKRRMEIIEKIVENSKTEIPKMLIDVEKNKMIEEMKASISQAGMKWEDYLGQLKKKEEELMQEQEKDAEKKVKINLILREIKEKEEIKVSEDEIKEEADKIINYYKNFGQDVDEERVKAYAYGILSSEKVFKFLELC